MKKSRRTEGTIIFHYVGFARPSQGPKSRQSHRRVPGRTELYLGCSRAQTRQSGEPDRSGHCSHRYMLRHMQMCEVAIIGVLTVYASSACVVAVVAVMKLRMCKLESLVISRGAEVCLADLRPLAETLHTVLRGSFRVPQGHAVTSRKVYVRTKVTQMSCVVSSTSEF